MLALIKNLLSGSLTLAGLGLLDTSRVATDPVKGHVFRTLPSGRTYLLNVPELYVHGTEHPLVFSFHGAGGYSLRQERITELSDPSLHIGGVPLLAVYPQGLNNTDWGMTHIWQGAPYANETADDIQYVKDIIADVSANYTVDARRRYACGKSNGGGFTALLSCREDTASLFAAFAPVAPALYPGTRAFSHCEPGRPVPILHAHGLEDIITPFHGRGPSDEGLGPEPDVRDWRNRWAIRNGCKPDDKSGLVPPAHVLHDHVNATEQVWECDEEVRALTVAGLGHAWPTTLGLDLAGGENSTATFNFTTAHLVPFFAKHLLPAHLA